MDPITDFIALNNLRKIGKKIITSKWLYVALAVIAIGAGTYFYLDHSTKQQVKSAVQNADSNATIKTYQTGEKVADASAKVDEQFDRRQVITQREYQNVRTTIIQAPSNDRDAPASPVVIGTLNNLERMSAGQGTGEGGVPDAEVPVG